jgi:pyruvate/2-oxoglutarate/acetoin dehydrogenase E1 component
MRRTLAQFAHRLAVLDFGAGAEIAARAGEELYDLLRVPVRRTGAPAVPMPFSPVLERALFPPADAIVALSEAMVREG